jgi:hypothetical protein
VIPLPLYIAAQCLFGTVAAKLVAGLAIAGAGLGHAYNRQRFEEQLDLGINLRQQAFRTIAELERNGVKVDKSMRKTLQLSFVPRLSTVVVPAGAFGPLLSWMEGEWILTPEERITFCHFVPRFHAEHGGRVDDLIVRLVEILEDSQEGRSSLAQLVGELLPMKLSTDEMRINLMDVKLRLTPARKKSSTYGKDLRETLATA